jgi:hypothetical protein
MICCGTSSLKPMVLGTPRTKYVRGRFKVFSMIVVKPGTCKHCPNVKRCLTLQLNSSIIPGNSASSRLDRSHASTNLATSLDASPSIPKVNAASSFKKSSVSKQLCPSEDAAPRRTMTCAAVVITASNVRHALIMTFASLLYR